MVIDETANIEDAARMVRMSKTTTMAQDVQPTELLAETSIYKAFLAQLQKEAAIW